MDHESISDLCVWHAAGNHRSDLSNLLTRQLAPCGPHSSALRTMQHRIGMVLFVSSPSQIIFAIVLLHPIQMSRYDPNALSTRSAMPIEKNQTMDDNLLFIGPSRSVLNIHAQISILILPLR